MLWDPRPRFTNPDTSSCAEMAERLRVRPQGVQAAPSEVEWQASAIPRGLTNQRAECRAEETLWAGPGKTETRRGPALKAQGVTVKNHLAFLCKEVTVMC